MSMTPQEAYEIALKAVRRDKDRCFTENRKMYDSVKQALAVLREHHAYFSKYQLDDDVVVIAHTASGWQIVHHSPVLAVKFQDRATLVFDYHGYAANEDYCFPTREAAQAECDRRNKEDGHEV